MEGGLVRGGHAFVLQHFVDFMFAELIIYFVRKIAGINKGLVADSLDGMGDIGFVAFAADENAPFVDVASDVVADSFFRTQLQKRLRGSC